MSALQPQGLKYGFRKTVNMSFDEAAEKTRAALQAEGFGVLAEIDIKEKLKEKLGVDFGRYLTSFLGYSTNFTCKATYEAVLEGKQVQTPV